MRSLRFISLAAFVALAGPAAAQGAGQPAAGDEQAVTASPEQQTAIDVAYRDRCEKGAPKELCACVISVADSQLPDPGERQVFFDFMMGEVDKAKTARGMFSPQKNMRFNTALQKADLMLGERCDKLKPKPAQAPAAEPSPDKKL